MQKAKLSHDVRMLIKSAENPPKFLESYFDGMSKSWQITFRAAVFLTYLISGAFLLPIIVHFQLFMFNALGEPPSSFVSDAAPILQIFGWTESILLALCFIFYYNACDYLLGIAKADDKECLAIMENCKKSPLADLIRQQLVLVVGPMRKRHTKLFAAIAAEEMAFDAYKKKKADAEKAEANAKQILASVNSSEPISDSGEPEKEKKCCGSCHCEQPPK